MMKKLYLILLMLLPLCMSAQSGSGSWTVHSRFLPTTAKNVIDTENGVYYLLGNDLFCFNKTTHETQSLNKTNDLSDVLANGIYYNHDKGYLVVTYDDANIDVITADGVQFNIPNLKDALIASEKGINHITFAQGKFYVATKFGYLVIDDTNFVVTESHNYSYNLQSVEEIGDNLILSVAGYFYYAGKNAKHETLSNFKRANNYDVDTAGTITKTYPGKTCYINDSKFFLNSSNGFFVVDITDNDGILTFTRTSVDATVADNVQKTKTGFLANYMAKKYYYTFDANGGSKTKVTSSVVEMYSCSPNGDGTLWSINASGLHNSAATSTYYKMGGILISTTPWWMAYNKSEHKMYVSSTTDNGILVSANTGAKYEMNTYDGSVWEDAQPTGVPTNANEGWYWPEFNPNDSSMYFISCRMNNGILRVQNGAVTAKLGTAAPMVARKGALRFDNDGNLWIVHSSLSNTTPVKVLAKEKLANATFAPEDYTVYNVPHVVDRNSFKWSTFAISKGTDIKVFTCGDIAPLVIWDNYGQITDGTNFRSKFFKSLISKSNKTITWAYTYELKADDFGYIWMGNGGNLVRFNPVEAFDDDFRVDDLSAQVGNAMVSAIAFGKDNCAWIATNGAGIYVLSQDGSEVLNSFNTNNSPLPSNSIYNLCYDPEHESMFVVTPTCILEYSEEMKGGETTYDNVTVFPEPVRPDFTGYVAIKRLIPGSFVKITDAAGNVLHETTDVAGTATWDACDSNGNRVATGAYYVYAATTENVPMDKPVAKIMVIK